MRIKAISYIVICACISTVMCKNKNNPIKQEQALIDEYHKKVVTQKGKEAFFIPKEEISWYFKDGTFLPVSEAQINDNVSFFDTLGNIQYQALVVLKSGDHLRVRCQNLTTGSYYITDLNTDSIKDLSKDYPYDIKVYREAK